MNSIVATIRSVIQALVALAVVAVGNFLLAELGLTIDVEGLTETISVAVFGLVVLGVNWLGAKFPIVNALFSLGFSADPATYEV